MWACLRLEVEVEEPSFPLLAGLELPSLVLGRKLQAARLRVVLL
jgi:hypothetical protein